MKDKNKNRLSMFKKILTVLFIELSSVFILWFLQPSFLNDVLKEVLEIHFQLTTCFTLDGSRYCTDRSQITLLMNYWYMLWVFLVILYISWNLHLFFHYISEKYRKLVRKIMDFLFELLLEANKKKIQLEKTKKEAIF